MSLGERIKSRRKELGLTLRQLEARTGLSNAAISQIETGHVGNPGVKSLRRIAMALAVPTDYLVSGPGLVAAGNGHADPEPPRPVRIAFDVGGVLSKYPEIFRPFALALVRGGAEVHVITDMHEREQSLAMLAMNRFDFIPPERVHNSDFETYGEACKAVLLERLGIEVMIDDFPAYLAAGCPVRLQVLPDITRPYYADDWKTPADVGDFGRRRRVDAYRQRTNG